MRIDTEIEKYLNGDIISNGAHFAIPKEKLISRDALLLEFAAKRTVLHIGCADHLELIEQKRRKGTYLHDKLADCASELIGADINEAAISAMQSAGFRNICHVSELDPEKHFDVVLIPDVIEHVADVRQFLEWVKAIDFSLAVITTPNAFRLENRFLFREEFVNTDHRYWFSPYTLCRSVVGAGLLIKSVRYTDKLSPTNPLASLIKWLFPVTRDGIALVMTKT